MHILFFRVIVIICLTVTSVVGAEANEEKRSIDRDQKRGWWWYKAEPETTKDEEKEKKDKRLPSMSGYTNKTLWEMHPDDFSPLMMAFHKKAVMSPTMENVRDYYQIQDIARRKALAFTNVASAVVQQHPEFSTEADFPTAMPGKAALAKQQAKEITNKISQAREQFGLIYFYSPFCEFCKAQDGIMQFFMEKYQWNVKRVDITVHTDIAETFGVSGVPYLLLIRRGSDDAMPVSVGVVALSDLENRLYRAIRLLSKEITAEEFSMYEFERGKGFDPKALLKIKTGG